MTVRGWKVAAVASGSLSVIGDVLAVRGLLVVGLLLAVAGVVGVFVSWRTVERNWRRELRKAQENARRIRQASATRYAPFDSGPAAHIAQPREDA